MYVTCDTLGKLPESAHDAPCLRGERQCFTWWPALGPGMRTAQTAWLASHLSASKKCLLWQHIPARGDGDTSPLLPTEMEEQSLSILRAGEVPSASQARGLRNKNFLEETISQASTVVPTVAWHMLFPAVPYGGSSQTALACRSRVHGQTLGPAAPRTIRWHSWWSRT